VQRDDLAGFTQPAERASGPRSATEAVAERAPEPVHAAQSAPAWKMEPVTLPADMVMIETRAKAPAFEPEPEQPRRARTPRPRNQPLPEEPLQQVETGKQPSVGGDAVQ